MSSSLSNSTLVPSTSLRDYSEQREKFIILFRRTVFDWLKHLKQFQNEQSEVDQQKKQNAISNYSDFHTNKLNKFIKQSKKIPKELPIDRFQYAKTMNCKDIISLLTKDPSSIPETKIVKLPECQDNKESVLYSNLSTLSNNTIAIKKRQLNKKGDNFYTTMNSIINDFELIIDDVLKRDVKAKQISPWETVLGVDEQKRQIPTKPVHIRTENEYRKIKENAFTPTEKNDNQNIVNQFDNKLRSTKDISTVNEKQHHTHKTKHFGTSKSQKDKKVLSFVEELRNITQ